MFSFALCKTTCIDMIGIFNVLNLLEKSTDRSKRVTIRVRTKSTFGHKLERIDYRGFPCLHLNRRATISSGSMLRNSFFAKCKNVSALFKLELDTSPHFCVCNILWPYYRTVFYSRNIIKATIKSNNSFTEIMPWPRMRKRQHDAWTQITWLLPCNRSHQVSIL